MLSKRERRRRSAVRREARGNVRSGIVEKSTLFVITVIAFVSLIALDGTKTRFDVRYDKNGVSAITVNDKFINALGIPDPTEINHWLIKPSHFKHQQYDNQKQFINALAARASAEYANASASLQAEKQSLTNQKEQAQIELAKVARRKQTRETKEKQIQQLEQKIAATEAHLANLDENYKGQYAFIRGDLAERLPQVMLTLNNHSPGLLDQLFHPILDEKNSLHIVFQILRMTALIIIVLTFIFIVVMGFQMLPLASGASTASDHLRSLISMKAAAAGSEVAKVAIIGVTAVGIGTAVVVGNHALQGGGSAIVDSRYFPPASGGPKPSYTTEPPTTDVDHPIEFKPNITLPEPLVLDQRTIVAGDNAKVLSQLEALIKALPNAQTVATLEGRLHALENKPPPNTANYLDALVAIKTSIDRIASLPGPCPCPKLPSDNDTLKIDFQPLLTVITRMETELKKTNEDERPRQGADDRNAWARTKDFIRGADYFAVTLHSLDNLKKALTPTVLDPKLEQVLKDMMALPPQRKSQFLGTLRLRVERTADSTLALAQLKQYERKILNYFKLSN